MDNKPNRIPAADSGAYRNWSVPEIADGGHVVPAAAEVARSQRERAADTVYSSLTASELESITQQAQDEGYREGLESGRCEGHREGFAAGRSEGLEAAREEVDATLERFTRLSEQLLQPLEQQRTDLQQSLTELTLALARAVIGRDPVTAPAQVLAAVEQALAALPAGADGIEVRLHPADLELLRESGRALPEWRLLEDSGLAPGDVGVRTRHSVVDFTRETRFQQLLAALLEEGPRAAAEDADDPAS